LVANLTAIAEPITLERVTKEHDKLEEERKRKLAERDGYTKTIQDSSAEAEAKLAVSQDAATVDSALAQLKEQLVAVESLLSNLEPSIERFPCSDDQPFSELAVTIGTVRQLSGDFQVTLSKEQNAVKVIAEASNRKDQLEKQLAGLLPRIERFTEARQVLAKIQNEHSLNTAMEEALRQNREAIEAIFARIHSPAEFSGLGSSLITLVRKNNAGTATLQQISTGQRAAFALSLFLAQNAQLRSAPPLMLIDDPIAHVDDLNCLSFLDYLREVVIAGDRQVVFATANDKLAMLFERKFDFLGDEEFRRYDLIR
jgi:DNA repair exonuclease SbcCD ATPase subunit